MSLWWVRWQLATYLPLARTIALDWLHLLFGLAALQRILR